ncbi:Phage antitermination protein Q [Serratia quinivorans]|nr:Phage antitermination protein Q [Serratia quinivorans]CAI0924415.1 Phage antitermination protein Q [Serratia quinivorans]CAI1713632.1 Phage antitermination protein Q [Serratia quinivorans]CAI2089368.1 Phage antitermination protein Q [Serratia quinivorans]CAI2454667.1 Phage antitermination protein Q [Serratia quinivorans]
MRRNMQEVLERWGRWAVSEEKCTSVDWPAMSVTPGQSLLGGGKTCSDDDGLMIDGCIARLKSVRQEEEILMLGLRYIAGCSQRDIAAAVGVPRAAVERHLQSATNFVEGCLAVLDVPLDMDPEVAEIKIVVASQKPMLYL